MPHPEAAQAWKEEASKRHRAHAKHMGDKAQEILAGVLQKHHRQSQKKDWSARAAAEAEPARGGSLAQEMASRAKRQGRDEALDTTVSAKIIDDVADGLEDAVDTVEDVATDGTGLVGDALGDAYAASADKISFVANTVIDTVEQALQILLNGFDFDADCDASMPTLDIDTNGITIGFGRQSCELTLVGQHLDLFDINWGTISVPFPPPLAAMIAMGFNLVNCISDGGPAFDVFKCVAKTIGETLLQVVPPFGILTSMSTMLSEYLAYFAQLASAAITLVLSDTTSMVQEAATVTDFPAHGEPARLVSSRKGVATHIRRQVARTKVPRKPGSFPKAALVQTAANSTARVGEEPDDTMGSGAIGLATTEAMPYASMLITQFGGKEFDSASCLGFAPKHRTGPDGKVTQRDWQAPSPDSDDFVKLEPWAVPCDNQWAKDNPDKWEGYSFYTYASAVEKCVAISYSMSAQPVLAFVGGLEFDLMPAPLAEVTTEVCWPDRVTAPDLSLIVTTIRTAGIVLFKHTIRLTKRFGSGTDFNSANIKEAVERAKNYFGKGSSDDDDKALEGMSRTALSQDEAEEADQVRSEEAEEDSPFTAEIEELFMASGRYDTKLGVNLTQRFHGEEAASRLRAAMRPKSVEALQEDEEGEEEDGPGLTNHVLWELGSPSGSLVGFQLIGELEAGMMQLRIQMQFGPLASPKKVIPLLHIVDHLRVILAAIPFVSQASKQKAVDAMLGTDLASQIPPNTAAGLLPMDNGWASYGGVYRDAVYQLRGGICSVQALVRGPNWDVSMATLPAECRPSSRLVFHVNRDAGAARLDVLVNGQIKWVGGSSGGWVSMTGITFATGAAGWPVPLQNGWTPYGGDYAPPSFRVIAGICMVSGLARAGHWSTIGTLPSECRPTKTLIFNLDSGNGVTTRVDVLTSGAINYNAGGNSDWLSLSGIIFSVDADENMPLQLAPGLSNYGRDFGDATYTRTEGLCILEGLLSHHTITNQVMATLPVECWPFRELTFSMNHHEEPVRVNVKANGEIWHLTGGRDTRKFISLSGIAFAPAPDGLRITPLAGGWVNFDSGYAQSMFTYKSGLCVLEGLVGSGTWGQTMALLPEECRPSKKLIFHANNHAGSLRMDITADGAVAVVAGVTGQHWTTFSNVVFAPGTLGHLALPLEGAWNGYGGEYGSPDYTVRNGICSVEGLIRGGSWGSYAVLPEDCRPQDGRMIFTCNNHALSSRCDVEVDGRISWVAGGTSKGFVSLSGIVFAPGLLGYNIPLVNGWANHGQGYASAKYRRADGLCILSGLVSAGTSNHAATLPEDCRPKSGLTVVFDANAQDKTARVDIAGNGDVNIQILGNDNNWVSLSGIVLTVE